MFKRFILVLFLSSALLFTGCSYLTNFFIINNTNSNITVEYKIRDANSAVCFVPYSKVIDSKKNKRKIFRNDSLIIIDSLKNVVKQTLFKGESIWIGDDINFAINDNYDRTKLKKNLIYLKIKTKQSEITADSSTVVDLFKTIDRYNVSIEVN